MHGESDDATEGADVVCRRISVPGESDNNIEGGDIICRQISGLGESDNATGGGGHCLPVERYTWVV